MRIVSWVLQVLLGILFVAHGIAMVIGPEPMRAQLATLPYPSAFLVFIGICEALGGLGLILPMATRIASWLTPLAAIGLAIIMAGAVWTHLVLQADAPGSIPSLVLTLLLAFVAYVRWPLMQARLGHST